MSSRQARLITLLLVSLGHVPAAGADDRALSDLFTELVPKPRAYGAEERTRQFFEQVDKNAPDLVNDAIKRRVVEAVIAARRVDLEFQREKGGRIASLSIKGLDRWFGIEIAAHQPVDVMTLSLHTDGRLVIDEVSLVRVESEGPGERYVAGNRRQTIRPRANGGQHEIRIRPAPIVGGPEIGELAATLELDGQGRLLRVGKTEVACPAKNAATVNKELAKLNPVELVLRDGRRTDLATQLKRPIKRLMNRRKRSR
jgi:hypothetical protein